MTKREGLEPDLQDLLSQIDAMDDDLDELDDRLEALAAGTLSEPVKVALIEEAAEDPLLQTAVHVMRPLGGEMHARLMATAREAYHEVSEEEAAAADAPEDQAPVVELRPNRGWPVAQMAIPVLLAAVALFLLLPRGAGTLPDYQVEWRSGEQSLRSEVPQTTPRFTQGSAIEVWARPARAAGEPVQARVFLDDWAHPLAVDPSIAASGGVRVRGELGQAPWTLAPGPHTLIVAVGPADALVPSSEPGPPWQVTTLPFEVY